MLSTVKSCIALYLTLLYPLYWATIKKLHLKNKKRKSYEEQVAASDDCTKTPLVYKSNPQNF